MPTRTYFVHDAESGAIKIGATRWIDRRLMTLQVGNPHRLVLLADVPDPNVERWFHDHFRDHRLVGEWYRDDAPGLRDAITEMVSRFIAEVSA